MVYLLCFHSKFKHAKHYLGYCNDGGLDARMAKHSKGTGAKLMAAIAKDGIGFTLARVWPTGDRNFERKLKNRNNTKKLCPVCNPKAMESGSNYESIDNETRYAGGGMLDVTPIVTPFKSEPLNISYPAPRSSTDGNP